MWARLARHTFKDRPDWIIINEDVPIGKLYKIQMNLMGAHPFKRGGIIENSVTGERRPVECVLVTDEQGNTGMMVLEMLEIVGGPLETGGHTRVNPMS